MSTSMPIFPSWIALEWGTSELSVYAMAADNNPLERRVAELNGASLTQKAFNDLLRPLIQDWTLPDPCTIVACGMLDADQAWIAAPSRAVPCPATPSNLVRVPLNTDDLQLWLAPGIIQSDPVDVIRGEEVRIAGFLALNPDWDGVICLTGHQSKWAHVSAGEIVSFRSFMTGALLETLTQHTVLRHALGGADWEQDAFMNALSKTVSRPEHLTGMLYSLRAGELLHTLDKARANAQLSGALIGAELAASKPYWLGQRVVIIGNDRMSHLYDLALKEQGITPERSDADAAALAGLCAAQQIL